MGFLHRFLFYIIFYTETSIFWNTAHKQLSLTLVLQVVNGGDDLQSNPNSNPNHNLNSNPNPIPCNASITTIF